MHKKLLDCSVGDYVRVILADYSYDEVSKIITKDDLTTIVKYKNGKTTEYFSECKCDKVNFD